VTELRGQVDLGEKPKALQPIRREVTSAKEQTGETPIFDHVQELQRQANLGNREPQLFQPNPSEQQARERLGKPPPLLTPYQLLHPILRNEWKDFMAGLEELDADFLAKHNIENVSDYLLRAVLDLAIRPIPDLSREYGGDIHKDIIVPTMKVRSLARERLLQQWREKGIL
jgi:hypothetical protein